jgi:hypothetical protein
MSKDKKRKPKLWARILLWFLNLIEPVAEFFEKYYTNKYRHAKWYRFCMKSFGYMTLFSSLIMACVDDAIHLWIVWVGAIAIVLAFNIAVFVIEVVGLIAYSILDYFYNPDKLRERRLAELRKERLRDAEIQTVRDRRDYNKAQRHYN